MDDKLDIKDKQCQEKLQNILFNIELDFLQQNEIVEQLNQFLEEVQEADRQQIKNFLYEKFKEKEFLPQLHIGYEQEPNTYEQFEQLIKIKDHQNLINLFQKESFWEQDILPQQMQSIVGILTKLNTTRFFKIVEFAQYCKQRIVIPQFSLLKLLIEIKYFNLLDDQISLEQTIGSLLINQIYELEYYLDQKRQSNPEKFQLWIKEVQNLQRNPQIQNDQFGQFHELLKLLTQQDKIDIFLKKKLIIYSDALNSNQVISCLETYIRQNGDLDECYFQVVAHFWGRFCSYLCENKALMIKKIQEKQKILKNLLDKKKIKSIIPEYFFDRFIYFQEQRILSAQLEYQKFQQTQQIIKNEIQAKFQNRIPNPNNNVLWEQVQQLTYHSMNSLQIRSDLTKFLLKILWMNKREELQEQVLSFLFSNSEKNVLSYYQLLEQHIQQNQEYLKQDLLTLQIIQIYFQQNNQYQRNSLWSRPIDYYRVYQLSKQLLMRRRIFAEYPQKMKIDLENFNISLAEGNKNLKDQLIDNWIKQMINQDAFRNLIPFYFNIIKRGDSAESFTSAIQESFKRLKRHNNKLKRSTQRRKY